MRWLYNMIFKKYIKSLINRFRLLRKRVEAVHYEKIHFNADIFGTTLDKGVFLAKNSSIASSHIGRYTSIGRNSKIHSARIGSFCAISWDVTINAISHPVERLSISAFSYVPEFGNFVKKREQSYRQVAIGNDVWIGAHAVIMPGIKVGDGAVIGAGSIVTKDVAPYAIVAGCPARVIRHRFDEDIIERLLKLKWWRLPDNIIRNNIDIFKSDDILRAIELLEKIDND